MDTDKDLFMSLLRRRYPNITFDDNAIEQMYRGWWLHKAYASRRIKILERTVASQGEQLKRFLEQAR